MSSAPDPLAEAVQAQRRITAAAKEAGAEVQAERESRAAVSAAPVEPPTPERPDVEAA